MTLDECITILTEHQKWRRAEPPYHMVGYKLPHDAQNLGRAIDCAIEELHRLKGLEK